MLVCTGGHAYILKATAASRPCGGPDGRDRPGCRRRGRRRPPGPGQQVAQIERAQAETRKFAALQNKLAEVATHFAAEQSELTEKARKLGQEASKTGAEALKLAAEQLKLSAEQI
ncbi:hypothetical protein BKE38_01490 [Pseudoroseomonas deserti]|uniref:Uncharacterized protein n=1 Tax=Teichococcus deserti TaxID=1817963 RepID=A0A1V2H8T9_9PROT|nr:hypothetical protein [Pseudoroseomonas deserti]ONG58903.1 hypothetical protein BKE38_01490 [Pseudoroseomonas deserti]